MLARIRLVLDQLLVRERLRRQEIVFFESHGLILLNELLVLACFLRCLHAKVVVVLSTRVKIVLHPCVLALKPN